jgi:hypothetical protein
MSRLSMIAGEGVFGAWALHFPAAMTTEYVSCPQAGLNER